MNTLINIALSLTLFLIGENLGFPETVFSIGEFPRKGIKKMNTESPKTETPETVSGTNPETPKESTNERIARIKAENLALSAERERIAREKKETKEKRESLEKEAKELGISLESEKTPVYTRSESVSEFIKGKGTGETFNLSEIVSGSDEIYFNRGKKRNPKESETVSRLILPFAIRYGILSVSGERGKEIYKKVSPVVLKKTGTEN